MRRALSSWNGRHVGKRPSRTHLHIEELEERALLSVYYAPTQIQQAYGYNQLPVPSGSTYNTWAGAGQTIAIVDAYNDPNIQKDLTTFDAGYKAGWTLPAPPSFAVVNETGGSSLPSGNSSWGVEISLDVEWAHAMAPAANILLVEASSNSDADLFAAVKYAAQNASVVSMSWGGGESTSQATYDALFGSFPNVTFVASAGDSPGAIYPSTSPNVVSVGGTTLNLTSTGAYSSETGWSSTGGGYSTVETEPAYQKSYTGNSVLGSQDKTGARGSPDVGYDADPNTGVLVYDTYGDSGWYDVGGTSAGAPQWSAIIALANQQRAAASTSYAPLNSNTVLTDLYGASGDFHDITSGTAGSNRAGTGYDLLTGLGSPNVSLVVASLAQSPASVLPPSTYGTIPPPSGGHHGHSGGKFAGGSGQVLVENEGGLSAQQVAKAPESAAGFGFLPGQTGTPGQISQSPDSSTGSKPGMPIGGDTAIAQTEAIFSTASADTLKSADTGNFWESLTGDSVASSLLFDCGTESTDSFWSDWGSDDAA
jgi:subtilase family serine protease